MVSAVKRVWEATFGSKYAKPSPNAISYEDHFNNKTEVLSNFEKCSIAPVNLFRSYYFIRKMVAVNFLIASRWAMERYCKQNREYHGIYTQLTETNQKLLNCLEQFKSLNDAENIEILDRTKVESLLNIPVGKWKESDFLRNEMVFERLGVYAYICRLIPEISPANEPFSNEHLFSNIPISPNNTETMRAFLSRGKCNLLR
jgi:hypothetical protein